MIYYIKTIQNEVFVFLLKTEQKPVPLKKNRKMDFLK